jgi:cobaltochelatase CobT
MGIFSDIWARLAKGSKPNELKPLFEGTTVASVTPRPVASNDNTGAYHVFTRQFDRVLTADDLDRIVEGFGPVGKSMVEEGWAEFQDKLQNWRMRSHMSALKTAHRLESETEPCERRDTVVTLLLDQSGSMRGQKMMLAGTAVDVAQTLLGQLGCQVEILGFTTATWHGGEARRKWMRERQPPNPGRLADLLHIIYRSAEETWGQNSTWALKSMFWHDLPKENVDGEAIQWAASRLRARPEKHKVLVIISDGAPYEKATLSANGVDYLENHLRTAISEIEGRRDITLAAIGIGFDVTRFYRNTAVVKTAEDLGDGLPRLLARVLDTIYAQAARQS